MKCYSIKQPGILRKYVLSTDIKDIIPRAMRKRNHIAVAYLDFELFPGFSYSMFRDVVGFYGYGTTKLVAAQTDHGKLLPKTAMLLLYDHRRFHPDRGEGDKSRAVWINHGYELLVTCPSYLRLRETGTRNVWGIDAKGNLTQYID